MRKRLLALLLTGILLGLSACGGKTTEESKEVGNVVTEESKEETISTQETPEATEEADIGTEESEEEMQETTEAAPGEAIEETETDESILEPAGESLSVWVEERIRFYSSHKYEILIVKEDTYPALAKVIEDFNAKQVENSKEQLERLEQMAEEDYSEDESLESDATYGYVRDLYPVRTDKQVFSVLSRDLSYEGKRGEYCRFEAVTLDVETGKELTLGDVFKSGTDLTTILETELQENYPTFAYDAKDLVEENLIWTLGYKGVLVYFNSMDPNQPVQISVTYEEYPEIFKEDYIPEIYEILFEEPEGDYIRQLINWEDTAKVFVVDLYGDGKKDFISLRCKDNNYDIVVNDNCCFNWDNYSAYLDSVYLVKQDGRYYLYLDQWWDSDVEYLDVFEITDHSVKHVGSTGMELVDFTDPDSFVVVEHVCMFVEYWMKYECHVGPDGMPTPHEEVHSIDRTHYVNDYDYISLVDITAQLVDEQGNLLGTTYTFPAGTEFSFIRTDRKTYEDAKTGDGRYCRLYIDWPSEEEDEYYYYHPTVNGMDAEACFGPLHIIN